MECCVLGICAFVFPLQVLKRSVCVEVTSSLVSKPRTSQTNNSTGKLNESPPPASPPPSPPRQRGKKGLLKEDRVRLTAKTRKLTGGSVLHKGLLI